MVVCRSSSCQCVHHLPSSRLWLAAAGSWRCWRYFWGSSGPSTPGTRWSASPPSTSSGQSTSGPQGPPTLLTPALSRVLCCPFSFVFCAVCFCVLDCQLFVLYHQLLCPLLSYFFLCCMLSAFLAPCNAIFCALFCRFFAQYFHLLCSVLSAFEPFKLSFRAVTHLSLSFISSLYFLLVPSTCVLSSVNLEALLGESFTISDGSGVPSR